MQVGPVKDFRAMRRDLCGSAHGAASAKDLQDYQALAAVPGVMPLQKNKNPQRFGWAKYN
jgi:hypothetical protein